MQDAKQLDELVEPVRELTPEEAVAINGGAGAATPLMFDEADALFGKVKVKSAAHDKYANQEVGY